MSVKMWFVLMFPIKSKRNTQIAKKTGRKKEVLNQNFWWKENQEKKSKRFIQKGPTNGRNGRMANLGDMLIVYVFIKFEQKRLFI